MPLSEVLRSRLVLMCVIFTSTTSHPTVDYNSSALHFVPGTVVEYLEDPIFYDSYLPLLFQFQVPKHMDNALKIMWQHAIVCNASDSRYEGKLCPVVHHLHKIVANLSSDMGIWKDFIPPLPVEEEISSESERPLTSSTTSIPLSQSDHLRPPRSPNCGEIVPHFRHMYTTPEHLSEYLSTLANCPGTGHQAQPLPIISKNWVIDKQIYYTMVDRFYSEFYRSLPGTGNIDWVVTLNSYVAAQDLLLANNYMESARVLAALLQCNAGQIPLSFIKPGELRDALVTHRAKVDASHFTYLWGEQDLQSYYKLPIADCTLTKDYKLLVRILIPLKTPEVETKVLQLRTFPFMEKLPNKKGAALSMKTANPPESGTGPEPPLQLCKLQAPGSLRMIQSNFGLLFEQPVDGCGAGQLCSRHSLNSYIPLDACIAGMLSPPGEEEASIRKGCVLSCFPIDARSLPIFQRTSPSTFLALGTQDNQIFLQCGGQPLEKLALVDLGALEITLPCDCQISYRNLVLRPTTHCGGNSGAGGVRIRRLLPLHWEDFLRNGTHSGLDEVSLLSKMAEEKDKYYHYDTYRSPEEQSGQKKDARENEVDKEARILAQSLEDVGVSGGVMVQLVLLWILVLGLVGMNVGLAWNLHRLLQWRKMQLYKDTRIVYSVPPSPQFPHSNKF